MPVTTSLATDLGHNPFSDLTIIHVNHFLEDVLDLNLIFSNLGANVIFVPVIYGPKNLSRLLDLPYSTTYHYRERKRNLLRFDDISASAEFTYDIDQQILSALDIACSHKNTKILIVEDGGYHFDVLEKLASKCHGKTLLGSIEQTKSGVKLAEQFISSDSIHKHPVLSVARSKIKIRFENQFIALRVVEELSLLLYEINEFLSLKDVVITGYGIIGRALAFLLRRYQCNVKIIETNEKIRDVAKSEGFDVIQSVSSDLFETVPIIIGVTGTPSFNLEDFNHFLTSSADTLLLVSASSKRVEFSHLVNYFEGTAEDRETINVQMPIFEKIKNLKILRRKYGVEYKFSFERKNCRVVLLAEGYPVNFYRYGSESLPPKIVDLVNAEILALAHYIDKNHKSLDNRLYLLGRESLLNFNLREIDLFKIWLSKNYISRHIKPEHIWDVFPPHPCEEILSLSS